MNDWVPDLGQNDKPRYIAIAEAIGRDVASGTLTAGDRLPPQRRLATQLGIDFTTVSRGYNEARARGYVDSHVGRGTFVTGARPIALKSMGEPFVSAPAAADPARVLATDLSMNLPPEPTDPDLLARMQDGLSTVSANLIHLLRYQSATGSEQDRNAASVWLSLRGMVPRLERIAVTPGAHATITAVMSIICKPGDTVLCERITYPGVRGIAARMGVRLVGLEMDDDGILPGALEDAIARERPKALYLNPTLQNPTTITMPVPRRLAVSEIINHHRLPLIEDDAYGFIPAKAPAPIAVSSPHLTWHIGGLAKCIGAGLRLAYTVAPSGRDNYALGQAIRSVAVMPSPLATALATRWIEDGTADHIRRFIRSETEARQLIAADTLEGLSFRAAPNAFNIWLTLPPHVRGAELVARLAGCSIGIIPAEAFTVDGALTEQLRICLGGSVTRETLRTTLFRLADAV